MATHGNRFGAHGKEGVDGSSPSEGSAKVPAHRRFCVQPDLQERQHAVGMEPFMELSRFDRLPSRRLRPSDDFGAQFVVPGFVAVDLA